MTRQTMLAAASELPRSPIYGIGVLRSGDDIVDYEIGWDDFERDTDWALAQLTEAGVTATDHVLVTTPNHEAPWLSPLVHALRRIGATYTPAETYGWDAARFVSVLGRMPITVVIGLGSETLTTVASQHDDLRAFFSGVRLIWARDDAYGELSEAGVEGAAALALIGPALGLAQPGTPDLVRVNGAEWALRDENGSVVVSSVGPRRAPLTDIVADIDGVTVGADAVRLHS